MAPEKAPAFQFYPKDFLTDGRVSQMSLAELGAYIKLICICWQERTLPISPKRLANVVGVDARTFGKLWPAIQPCFQESEGSLIHPRLEKERGKQEQFRQRQSAKGKQSASNRGSTMVQPKPQPEGNRKATELQPKAQPKLNSPISDLRTTLKDHTHTPARGTLFGAEHRAHAACGRVCVPAFLHREFRLALGGEEDEADQRLRDWYDVVWSALPADDPVESDGVKFWRPQFALAFVKPKKAERSEADENASILKEIQRLDDVVKR